jgi:hypothetical protein
VDRCDCLTIAFKQHRGGSARCKREVVRRGMHMRYFLSSPTLAGMAELADAADSKSADPCGHGGSTPPPGTNKTKSLD